MKKLLASDIINLLNDATNSVENIDDLEKVPENNLEPDNKELNYIYSPIRSSYNIIGRFSPGNCDNGGCDAKTHPNGHPAVDFQADAGTPVYAIGKGKVSNITHEGGANTLGGNTVSTIHYIDDKKIETYNAHLSSINVSVGEDVDENTELGTVGKTGSAKNTSPHLHFQVKMNGGLVDPLSIINRKISSIYMEMVKIGLEKLHKH